MNCTYFEQNINLSKTLFLLGLLVSTFACSAQLKIKSTEGFSIMENGKQLSEFTIAQTVNFTDTSLGNIRMVNSKGEEKTTRKNVKGILLKDVLAKITFNVSKAKELHQYVFLLEATDGHKAALSYNEVFTTDNIYIVTESDGVVLPQSTSRIEILALSKPGRGHIYIKGLMSLTVRKVD